MKSNNILLLVVLFYFVCVIQTSSYELLSNFDLSSGNWKLEGRAQREGTTVRLIPDELGATGSIAHHDTLFSKNFQMIVVFSVESNDNIRGDGFAIWLTETPFESGSLYGGNPKWVGAGIFVNQMLDFSRNPTNLPVISIQTNDGSIVSDGVSTLSSFCPAIIHNQKNAFLNIVYQNGLLSIFMDLEGNNQWRECNKFAIDLSGVHIALSSMHIENSDSFIIHSISVNRLVEPENHRQHHQQEREQSGAPLQHKQEEQHQPSPHHQQEEQHQQQNEQQQQHDEQINQQLEQRNEIHDSQKENEINIQPDHRQPTQQQQQQNEQQNNDNQNTQKIEKPKFPKQNRQIIGKINALRNGLHFILNEFNHQLVRYYNDTTKRFPAIQTIISESTGIVKSILKSDEHLSQFQKKMDDSLIPSLRDQIKNRNRKSDALISSIETSLKTIDNNLASASTKLPMLTFEDPQAAEPPKLPLVLILMLVFITVAPIVTCCIYCYKKPKSSKRLQ